MTVIVSAAATITAGATLTGVSNIVEMNLGGQAGTTTNFRSGGIFPARFNLAGTSTLTGRRNTVAVMLGRLKSRTIMRIRSKQWEW